MRKTLTITFLSLFFGTIGFSQAVNSENKNKAEMTLAEKELEKNKANLSEPAILLKKAESGYAVIKRTSPLIEEKVIIKTSNPK